jgi:AcrR family transcriptional regulator
MPTKRKTAAFPEKGSAYHHGDLESALKAATVALIEQRGVDAFSLREAAAAVGVSPSAAYRHFADKAELLASVARDAFVELGNRFETNMARAAMSCESGDAVLAKARFLAQGRAYVQFALDHPVRFQVMFGPFGAGREGGIWRPEDERKGTLEMLSAALDDLVRSGAISRASREGAEVTVWSAIHGLSCLLVAKAFKGSTGPRAYALVDQVVLQLLDGMAAPPSTASLDR